MTDTPDTTPTELEPEDPTPGRRARYALYDDTLERYVSGVVTSKAKLADARKAQPKDHQLTVREV